MSWPPSSGARELLDARDPVASVHGVLAAFRPEWLLVFDNAPDRASVAGVPAAGGPRAGADHQPEPRSGRPARPWRCRCSTSEVAAEFLVNRTGDPDRQAAWELAGELGGLPLALEQAAAYIQASGDSLAGYLASFRQRRADMLARGEPTGYSKTVATTWALAFERPAAGRAGRGRPAAAAGVLRARGDPAAPAAATPPGLAGRLGEEVAPVLAPLLEDPLAAGDAIAALRRYSLVTPAADGSVSVHRLVQAVTADQMPAELARHGSRPPPP